MFPSGAFHYVFLLAPAFWHQEMGSFDSAFCLFYFFSVYFPLSFLGCTLGVPQESK